MGQKLTTSITKISSLLRLIESHQINPGDLFAASGVPLSALDSPDNRITQKQMYGLITNAVKATGDQNFGLHMGEAFSGFSNILGHTLMNCSTLKETFEKYLQYEKLSDEGTREELLIEKNYAILKVIPYYAPLAADRHFIDYRLSGCMTYIRLLTGKSMIPREVRFQHTAPVDPTEYERVFGCHLEFNNEMNALVYDPDVLSTPILEPNRELRQVFEEYAQAALKKLLNGEKFTDRVYQIIIKNLNSGMQNIDSVAGHLNMGVRTLQSRLKAEGTSFREILKKVQKELAINYLSDKQTSIGEIAYYLGFSDVSVFHRAFKRWTNHTPNSYRRILQA